MKFVSLVLGSRGVVGKFVRLFIGSLFVSRFGWKGVEIVFFFVLLVFGVEWYILVWYCEGKVLMVRFNNS